MIFRFKRKQFSDVVKVVDFLEKSGIDHEVITDIDIKLADGGLETLAASDQRLDNVVTPKMTPTTAPIPTAGINNDPLWRGAAHDGFICNDRDCREVVHYGAEAL